MTILVTGATGFLGGRLTRALCEQGHPVRALGRPGDPTEVLQGLECEIRFVDLLDEAGMARAVAGVDSIFHVAALVTLQPERYHEQLRVNVEGTRQLLFAARRAGVRRLVFTSTVNTLGIPPEGEVGDEDTPYNWGPYALGYMDSKRASEELVTAAAREWHTVSVLPGTFFGPGDIFFSAGTYIRESARGRLKAALPGGTTVVHVDDIVQGHLAAWERGTRGGRYILGGEHVSYLTLFTWIAAAVGRRPPFGILPEGLLVGGGRLADRLRGLGLPMPGSEGLAVAGCARLYYSSARAERELGYSYRPARLGIQDAVDWYRSRGLI